ncbi:serine hydrolase family protein [bacterium]|nr:serine hydrolase family protein [bacterium]
MMRFIILHGTQSSPQANWFRWLQGELEQAGHQVIVPQFPTPEGQSLANWLETFAQECGEIDAETILIGHSIGATFALRLSEQSRQQAYAAFLVAGFIRKLDNPEFDPLIETFVAEPFNWKKIQTNSLYFQIWSGTDDPYVPVEYAQEIAAYLGIEPVLVPGGKHLNSAAGYRKFPELLEQIEILING